MKKFSCFFIMVLIPIYIFSHKNYDDLVYAMRNEAPNVAFYNYQQFQKYNNEIGNLYYQMGMISFYYLKNTNPIKDFNSFDYYAYNAKLYLESALYFTDEAELRKYARYFYGIYSGSDDKLSKEEFKSYIDEKLDSVSYFKEYGHNVYNAFYNLSNIYETCVAEFYKFNLKFERINDALLLVEDEDIDNLNNLKLISDSLPIYIDCYLNSLVKFPIKNYSPEIVFYPIDFYRVDGLCSVDFLQNKVVLYDYSKWVNDFIDKYNRRIIPMINNSIDVFGNLMQSTSSCAYNEIVNSLYKIDEESYVAYMIQIVDYHNFVYRLMEDVKNINSAEKSVRKLYDMKVVLPNVQNTYAKLAVIDDSDYMKYKKFNSRYLINKKPEEIVKSYVDSLNSYYENSLAFFEKYIVDNGLYYSSLQEKRKISSADLLNDMVVKQFKSKSQLNDANVIYLYRFLDDLFYVFYKIDNVLDVDVIRYVDDRYMDVINGSI